MQRYGYDSKLQECNDTIWYV